MKIKESKRLKVGDVFKWEVPDMAKSSNDNNHDAYRTRTTNVQVIESYSHHIIVVPLTPPHVKVGIQNVELYMKGYYTPEDATKPFTLRRTNERVL